MSTVINARNELVILKTLAKYSSRRLVVFSVPDGKIVYLNKAGLDYAHSVNNKAFTDSNGIGLNLPEVMNKDTWEAWYFEASMVCKTKQPHRYVERIGVSDAGQTISSRSYAGACPFGDMQLEYVELVPVTKNVVARTMMGLSEILPMIEQCINDEHEKSMTMA